MSEKITRQRFFVVRVTEAERQIVKALAARERQTVSAFVRALLTREVERTVGARPSGAGGSSEE